MVGIFAIELLLFYDFTNLIQKKFYYAFRDPENTLLQNLKDVLEIDFPARAILEKSVSVFIALIFQTALKNES